MAKYAMVIDLDRCTGCRACMIACKVENNTPEGIFWMYLFRLEEGKYPSVHVWFMPRPCMHCAKPPCVMVCPVGATYQDDKGRVCQDSERCIGCRYCMQACPYGVRYFNDVEPATNYYLDWQSSDAKDLHRVTQGVTPPYRNPDLDQRYPVGLPEFQGKTAPLAGGGHLMGVVEKCTFCVHRTEKGLLPACVVTCPEFALHFGDLDDPESEVSQLLRSRGHFRLIDEYGTEPKVYYIGGRPLGSEVREIEEVRSSV